MHYASAQDMWLEAVVRASCFSGASVAGAQVSLRASAWNFDSILPNKPSVARGLLQGGRGRLRSVRTEALFYCLLPLSRQSQPFVTSRQLRNGIIRLSWLEVQENCIGRLDGAPDVQAKTEREEPVILNLVRRSE